jgi:hypothetical protein
MPECPLLALLQTMIGRGILGLLSSCTCECRFLLGGGAVWRAVAAGISVAAAAASGVVTALVTQHSSCGLWVALAALVVVGALGVRRLHPARGRPSPPSGQAVAATLGARPANCCPSAATSSSARSSRTRLRSRSQPFGRRSGRLIRAATMAGSHGRMIPAASSRSRHVRTVRLDRPV